MKQSTVCVLYTFLTRGNNMNFIFSLVLVHLNYSPPLPSLVTSGSPFQNIGRLLAYRAANGSGPVYIQDMARTAEGLYIFCRKLKTHLFPLYLE